MTAARCPSRLLRSRRGSQIHGPALVAPLGATPESTNPGSRGVPALVTEPAFQLQDAVHGLAVDQKAVPEAQQCPEAAVAEGWVFLDEFLYPVGEEMIRGRFLLRLGTPITHG